MHTILNISSKFGSVKLFNKCKADDSSKCSYGNTVSTITNLKHQYISTGRVLNLKLDLFLLLKMNWIETCILFHFGKSDL